MNSNVFAPFLLLILLGLVSFAFNSAPEAVSYDGNDPSFNREYWSVSIEKKGPSVVYREFLEKNASASVGRQHFASHVIGEVLFESEGSQGIKACDASFGFGCYHGLFGRAVAALGVAVIPEFDALCVETYGILGTGCQHGIGHGVMEYVGGDRLHEALDLCKKTTQVTTLLGCTSGVFMEYLTPLAGSGESQAPRARTIDPARPYVPCTFIDTEYKDSCYFELGRWFLQMLPDDHEQAGEMCEGITEALYRTRCWMGFGSLVAHVSGYSESEVRAVCAVFGEGELPCRAGASWAFFSDPSVRERARSVCAFAEAETERACTLLSDLTEGKDGRVQAP